MQTLFTQLMRKEEHKGAYIFVLQRNCGEMTDFTGCVAFNIEVGRQHKLKFARLTFSAPVMANPKKRPREELDASPSLPPAQKQTRMTAFFSRRQGDASDSDSEVAMQITPRSKLDFEANKDLKQVCMLQLDPASPSSPAPSTKPAAELRDTPEPRSLQPRSSNRLSIANAARKLKTGVDMQQPLPQKQRKSAQPSRSKEESTKAFDRGMQSMLERIRAKKAKQKSS